MFGRRLDCEHGLRRRDGGDPAGIGGFRSVGKLRRGMLHAGSLCLSRRLCSADGSARQVTRHLPDYGGATTTSVRSRRITSGRRRYHTRRRWRRGRSAAILAGGSRARGAFNVWHVHLLSMLLRVTATTGRFLHPLLSFHRLLAPLLHFFICFHRLLLFVIARGTLLLLGIAELGLHGRREGEHRLGAARKSPLGGCCHKGL